MAVNHASRRVLEKCGLLHIRTDHPVWPVPIPGSEHGEVVYELTRSHWLENQAWPIHQRQTPPGRA
jgi:RimJ/RimL family protein N-acetyltransferase